MASGRQGAKQQPAAADQAEFDPKYEWQENATSFLLRLHLSGFRKEDFRVQVDGAGRLTLRGQRPDGGNHSRFNIVFQLPATSNLDDITGRFDAGVLTLTVPKRPAAPPAPMHDISNQQADDAKPKAPVDEAKPKDEPKKQAADHEEAEVVDKPKEDASNKAADQVMLKADAKTSKPEQDHKTAAPPAVRKEERKPKAEAAPSAPATEKKQAMAKPPQPDGDRATKAADPESLAERAKRRAEEERAKAAAEEAGRERTAARVGWKERVAGGLEGLAGSEWAEGLVDTVKKNKEVLTAAVAAFSLGLFVSSRLFSSN